MEDQIAPIPPESEEPSLTQSDDTQEYNLMSYTNTKIWFQIEYEDTFTDSIDKLIIDLNTAGFESVFIGAVETIKDEAIEDEKWKEKPDVKGISLEFNRLVDMQNKIQISFAGDTKVPTLKQGLDILKKFKLKPKFRNYIRTCKRLDEPLDSE